MATIGSNVTGVIQNSTTSALTLNGQLNVNSTGTTLTNSAGGQLLTLTGNVLGTGNLTLNNNSSTAAGITLNGSPSVFVNNNGTLTNAGSGSGSVVISTTIGPNGTSNVTEVVENSATSQLTLSGANTYTGATSVSAGTLAVNGTSITDTSAVTVASGATLALSGSETMGSLAGAGIVTLGATTLTAGGNNTSTTFNGTASGSGGLTKVG
ncbi:MAG: autotransporter-associated beta strand repeat-containing protein, partial [Rhodoferax sp.]|nr:autotransporter-associated beta strand repeat-containing protein [Rhodoferax sp.]